MIARLFSVMFLLGFSSWVHATWTDEGGDLYSCTSGSCTMTCDAVEPCDNFTFVATQAADSALVFCSASSSCTSARFFLAAEDAQTVNCGASDACTDVEIFVGVPATGVTGIDEAVPSGFAQADFFGEIANFTLSCAAASSCDSVSVTSYYDIANQSVSCTNATDSCSFLDFNASSIDGDISLACLSADACDNVSVTARTNGSAQCADNDPLDAFDHCATVSLSASAAPSPDIDGDGVVDSSDLCPTGLSSITDANSDGCDDVSEPIPDSDGDGVNDALDGQELVWDGPLASQDENEFFDESNWLLDELPIGADIVNPDQVIGRELEMGYAFLELADNLSVLLGYGNSLTLNDTRLFGKQNTAFRPTSVTPSTDDNAAISLKGNAVLEFGWMWDVDLSLAGNSQAIALGSDESADTGVIGKGTTVDFKGVDSSLAFENLSVAEAEALVSKYRIDGAAAVLNTNVYVEVFETTGAQVLPDFDGDGFYAGTDLCPKGETVTTDWDNDGCEDSSEDLDDDNDGEPDVSDTCPQSTGADFDGDGCDASQDSDDDNDGKPDSEDQCLTENGLLIDDVDDDGCDDSTEDNDDDNDGVPDNADSCFTEDFDLSSDFDGDGCDDADEDKDDDNDSILDSEDAYPLDPTRSKKSGGGGGGGSLLWMLSLLVLSFGFRGLNKG